MVGYMLVHRGRVSVHAASLARRKVANRRGEPLIGEEMRRTHHGRHESPRHLVLALRSRFEALQFMLDAVFDALVVAGLEMQAVVVAAGAPVAAEQGIVAHEKYGYGDGFAADS